MAANLIKFFFVLFFLTSCVSKSIRQTSPPSTVKNETTTAPTEPSITTTEGSQAGVTSEFSTTPQTNNQPVLKSIPRLGLIFTGGGAKAWAHIGVLKEIEKAKWPIRGVAGVEWGAVVAASYAHQLSSNEVEWELSKVKNLSEPDLVASTLFENKAVADLKVPFVCPSLNIMQQQVFLLNRGQLKNLIPFCLAQYPLMGPYKQSVGMMSDLRALVQHLRATGAKKVILINVLAQKQKSPLVNEALSAENAIWAQAAAQSQKQSSGADDMIEINLDDYGIDDLDRRREIMAIGSEMSYHQIKKISEKYGL